MNVNFQFLGVGSASQKSLGHASAVVEIAGKYLLIDCGPGTLQAFRDQYECLPDAVYITHCHLDHVGDFENLFISSWFSQPSKTIKIYVNSHIVPLLQMRVASYPEVLAEGGVNFWDAFRLIPILEKFYWQEVEFIAPEVRHHAPKSAFGLYLPDTFFYTGDTRPIPEVISQLCTKIIFHDCSVVGNPSHSGIDDLKREYETEILKKIVCYHYSSPEQRKVFENAGLRVAESGEVFSFHL